MTCKTCGAALDFTMSECPGCGAEVELGRLTGILGIVCRACDAYNEPGARTCASCGKALGSAAAAEALPEATPAPLVPSPAARVEEVEVVELPPTLAPTLAPTPPRPAPAATRFVPSVRTAPPSSPPATSAPAAATRPAPAVPHVPAAPPAAGPGRPVATPIPLVPRCPRCGAEAPRGAFCMSCGQPLSARGTHVAAAPTPGRSGPQVFGALQVGRARLVLERGEGLDGATFRLDAEVVEAGRSRGAVIFPADPCLAPHHATFTYRDGALHVRDEGAPGGVYLRLRGLSVPLRPGEHFVVGDRLLRYAGPLPAAPAPPPDGTRRLGAPRPPTGAIVIEEWLEGGGAGRVFVRGGPSVTIGRAGCGVNLGDDAYLSQAHAEILVEGEGLARLRDLGSSNGTFVRIPARAERELRDGDTLRLGREVLRVAVAD